MNGHSTQSTIRKTMLLTVCFLLITSTPLNNAMPTDATLNYATPMPDATYVYYDDATLSIDDTPTNTTNTTSMYNETNDTYTTEWYSNDTYHTNINFMNTTLKSTSPTTTPTTTPTPPKRGFPASLVYKLNQVAAYIYKGFDVLYDGQVNLESDLNANQKSSKQAFDMLKTGQTELKHDLNSSIEALKYNEQTSFDKITTNLTTAFQSLNLKLNGLISEQHKLELEQKSRFDALQSSISDIKLQQKSDITKVKTELAIIQSQNRLMEKFMKKQLLPECEPTWELFAGRCHRIIYTKMNWNEANSKCQSLHSQLVIVRSNPQNQFIASHLPKQYVWIGGRSLVGTWRWVNGLKVCMDVGSRAFSNWREDEPDGPIGYMAIHKSDGQWVRKTYDHKLSFICEKSPL